jgi:uncharacterized protein with PIN domain
MAISIKNREAEALLQEIQAVTRRGKSQIVLDLLRHEVARLRCSHQFESRLRKLAELLATLDAESIAEDQAQADVAFQGFLRYGKGQHPAGLNFGDCFSYALAKVYDEPLLLKGDDFPRIDIVAAI